MEPKELGDDLFEALEAARSMPFSLTSSSCVSAAPSTSSAVSLWSAARAIAAEQIPISFRSRLLSLTIRMYSSMTGRSGRPSVSDAR